MADHGAEVTGGRRFEFGENWRSFLELLDERRVQDAEESMRSLLGLESLDGKSFLDIGSGSGLFSLSAMRLGAKRVHSFDYDPASAGCTRELKRRYFDNNHRWSVDEGSVLDGTYLAGLGKFDVVYSWGVLHHTGAMWKAIENASTLVADSGLLVIAIYNDQGKVSDLWLMVKKAYNRGNWLVKKLIVGGYISYYVVKCLLADIVFARNPLKRYRYERSRGMNFYRDAVDWVGGLPFEVAKPEEIVLFLKRRGFTLENLVTVGGRLGCNEFVFRNTGRGS